MFVKVGEDPPFFTLALFCFFGGGGDFFSSIDEYHKLWFDIEEYEKKKNLSFCEGIP